MGDAWRDHGLGWLALVGAGDVNRFGWAELASKPHPDQGEGGQDSPAIRTSSRGPVSAPT
jgi:hypothetical protein